MFWIKSPLPPAAASVFCLSLPDKGVTIAFPPATVRSSAPASPTIACPFATIPPFASLGRLTVDNFPIETPGISLIVPITALIAFIKHIAIIDVSAGYVRRQNDISLKCDASLIGRSVDGGVFGRCNLVRYTHYAVDAFKKERAFVVIVESYFDAVFIYANDLSIC